MTLRRGATLETLALRAELLARVRSWFAERGVLEVETASLSAAATPDPAIASFGAHGRTFSGYLHTSPEFMMKRLIADGAGDIYQLSRVYRDGELGRWHEPEFVLLEWYRVGCDEHALMDDVEDLLQALLGPARLRAPALRVEYDAAFAAALGLTSHATSGALADSLRTRNIDVPRATAHDGLLDLALSTVVSATFPQDSLTFVHDYPASQAALACINSGAHPTAARFEVFLGSLELGNGFRELTDAAEQRARFEAENAARRRDGLPPVPLDESFLAALDRGLPACAGVALGFDRVVALAAGARCLAGSVAFTHADISP